jgi:hypothetical protein
MLINENKFNDIIKTAKNEKIESIIDCCENISYCPECFDETPIFIEYDSYLQIIYSNGVKNIVNVRKYVGNILRVNPTAFDIFVLNGLLK